MEPVNHGEHCASDCENSVNRTIAKFAELLGTFNSVSHHPDVTEKDDAAFKKSQGDIVKFLAAGLEAAGVSTVKLGLPD